LVFPGQGSQYVGMGQDFYDKYEFARKIFDKANNILDYDLTQKIFQPKPIKKMIGAIDLDKNIFTQPAVLTCSYVCYEVLQYELRKQNIDLEVSTLMGHSLGEYTALLVSGAFDFKTALTLVNERARLITEYSEDFTESGLMAVADKKGRLDDKFVEDISRKYHVSVAIHNSRKQIVLGGSKKKLGKLRKKLKEEHKLAKILKVEGPFHTYLLEGAATEFKYALDDAKIQIASLPVICNVTAKAISDPEHIREELYHQIFKKVNWLGSVEKAINNGTDCFFEIGPKNILSKIVKEIDPTKQTMNVENIESLEKTINKIKNLTPPEDDSTEQIQTTDQEADLDQPKDRDQKSADQ